MQDINSRLLNSSAVTDLRGHPEFHEALNALIARAGLNGLRPLAEKFGALVDARAPVPLELGDLPAKTPMQQLLAGSDVASQSLKDAPQAAFLLAWLCVAGWSAQLGTHLYDQPDGFPHIGWATLPRNCAEAALRLGAIHGARVLADEGYDVLMSAKYWTEPGIQEYIESYRRLAARIWRKYEIALANLADDLRDSCRVQPVNFRTEVAALLWSLGMVPQSQLLASTAAEPWVPSRRLMLSVVRQSMQSLWFDSLVQYVWLELKDRGPFNIREHKFLFYGINARWRQSKLDEISPVPPSQSYARSLIAWFRGDLSDDQAREFMVCFQMQMALFPRVNLVDFVRFASFASMVAERFDSSSSGSASSETIEHWRRAAQTAGGMVRSRVMHPDSPEVYQRASVPFFHLIQRGFQSAPPGPDAGISHDQADALLALEWYRSGALSYWLEVVPPLPVPAEQPAIMALQGDEMTMLSYVRGAYFRMLSPILPDHFLRYSGDMTQMLEDQKERWQPADPDAGRARLVELAKALHARYATIASDAPRYASKRRDPTAGLTELLTAMNSHAVAATMITCGRPGTPRTTDSPASSRAD